MKHIVIAGGGFAGINTALSLDKRLPRNSDVAVTLIDRHPYHLAHTYLYELASSPEELTTLDQLKQSAAIPIVDILAGTRVKFQQAEIKQVDPDARAATLTNGTLNYDYLVLALGSAPNFYDIPGAEQYAIPLKSVRDSFKIRNRIQFLLDTYRLDVAKENIRIIVAGGGLAGVEMAAELKGLLDFLSWKNAYPRHKLEILVVEGTNQLMPGMDAQVAEDTYARLKERSVDIMVNSLIAKVEENFVEFKNGEKWSYDCLIWTAGVKANQAPFTQEISYDRGNRIITNSMFQIEQWPNIFVIGDEACFLDKSGKPLPGTARQAIHQGKYLGYTLTRLINGQTAQPFIAKEFGYIVPLGGKWGVSKSKHIYLKGFLAYVFRQIGWLHYFWSILGFRHAIKLSFLENRLYDRND